MGEFGADVQALADRLIGQGSVQLVASDAHHIHFRTAAACRGCRSRCADIAGVAAARVLCHDNPAAILAGGRVARSIALPQEFMTMPFPQFDRRQLRMQPLGERTHDLDRSCLMFPDSPREPFSHEAMEEIAERIVAAARDRPGRDLRLRRPRAPQRQRPAADRPDAARVCWGLWP